MLGQVAGLGLCHADLTKARLLVLSFCEGARGRVVLGEGARSLVEAAQMAGAQTVVASVLQVKDEATVRWMDRFYEGLLTGLSPARALRQAALLLRSQAGSADLRSWGGLSVTADELPRVWAIFSPVGSGGSYGPRRPSVRPLRA